MRITLKKTLKTLYNILLLLLLQFSDAQAQTDVTLDFGGEITGAVDEQVTISVNTSDLTGLDVANFDFEFAFDPALIQFETADILSGELLSSAVTKNVTSDNRILVSFASSTPISGAGTLFTMTGTLLAEGQNADGVSVTDIFMGDGSLTVSPSVPFSIGVTVQSNPISWSVNPQSVALASSDAASFNVSIEQTAGTDDLTWEVTDNADWLTIDGASSGVGSGSVTYNANENTTTASRSGTITVQSNAGTNTVSVSQPGATPQNIDLSYGVDITAGVGDEVSIPVTTSDLTDLNISNFDFEFQFDSSLLEILNGNITAGSLVSSITTNVTSDDRVLVSYADSSPITGSGVLFTITANAIAPGLNENGIVVNDVLLGDGTATITPAVPTGISVEILSNEPPVVSILNGPADGSTIDFNNPGFAWNGSDPDGTVAEYEVDLQGPSTTSFFTTETIHTFSDLSDGNYLFRVRAIDNNGAVSAWAERGFVVSVLPEVVTLSSPADNATGVSISTFLSWQEAARAQTYDLQVSTTSDFSTPVVDETALTGTEFQSPALAYDTGYSWRVRAVNGVGVGPWSTVWSFTTENEPSITITTSENNPDWGSTTGGGTYENGQTVEVIATAATGYTFVRWTEANVEVSTSASYSFTASQDRDLMAVFEKEQATTYSIFGQVVDENGAAISDLSMLLIRHDQSSNVTATTDGAGFYQFLDLPSGQDYTVAPQSLDDFEPPSSRFDNLSSNQTQDFQRVVTTYTITISENDPEWGSTSGGGTYEEGQTVEVVATPATGYNFVRWSEAGAEVSTDANYSFTAGGDRDLVAEFEAEPVVSYTITTSENNSEWGSTTGGGTYEEGQTVTVEATAAAGYNFVRWSEAGAEVSAQASYSFTASGDRDLVAEFEADPVASYTITTSENNSEWGSTTGGGTYEEGQTVTVEATAAAGYNFVRWSEAGAEVSTEASYSFTASADRDLVAEFEQQEAVLTVSPASLNFESSAGTKSFSVSSNTTWSVSDDRDWISVSGASGSGDDTEVSVSLEANPSTTERTGTVTVSGGGLTETVSITQAGKIIVMTYEQGWNLISIPEEASGQSLQDYFSNITESTAFEFIGQYLEIDDSQVPVSGKGYWLKLSEGEQVEFTGNLLGSLTLTLEEGWNLMGSIGEPLSVPTDIQDSGGIIENSAVWEITYNEGSDTYELVEAAEMLPGLGYFIKATSSGQITLSK